MIVTDSHGHNLFPVSSNHSRVYLPEQLVLHIDEYTKQKQEDNIREAKEAQKWGLSVEEYRLQNELLEKVKRDHDAQLKKDIPGIGDDRAQIEMIPNGKQERDKKNDLIHKVNLPDNQKHDEENLSVEILRGNNVREQQEEYERIQREHKTRLLLKDYDVIEGGAWMKSTHNEDPTKKARSHNVYDRSKHRVEDYDVIEGGAWMKSTHNEVPRKKALCSHNVYDRSCSNTEHQQTR